MIRRLSLRARLLGVAALITIVATVAADFVIYAEFRSYLYSQVDQTLEASHPAVESTADQANGTPVPGRQPDNDGGGGPGGGEASSFCSVGFESAPGMFIEVRTAKGAIVTGSRGREYCPSYQPGKSSAVPKLAASITGFKPSSERLIEPVVYFTTAASTGEQPGFRVRASKLTNGDILIVADPIGGLASTLERLVLLEVLVTAAAVVAASLLGLVLVKLGLRPLTDVEATADAITGGDLEHRVQNVNPRTEVGHVATALNVMLDRIEEAFSNLKESEERLRRFVADASHELRTPIAAVSAYTELFRRGALEDEVDLSRVLSGIERESERMGRLVEDLLTLAKLDEGPLVTAERVELVGLAHEALETAATVGPEWPVALEASGPVEVKGDRLALRRVLDNLLSNIRSHTPPGTRATLSVLRDGDRAVIEVADEGPGITEDEAQAIFGRFFRADPSRSRATGGAGLGLAIVDSVSRAHGGQASASTRPGGGAVFRVAIPLVPPEVSAEEDEST